MKAETKPPTVPNKLTSNGTNFEADEISVFRLSISEGSIGIVAGRA